MAKTKRKKVERSRDSIFWENLSRFLGHIESLEKALISMKVMMDIHKIESRKIETFIKEKATNVKEVEEGNISFSVPSQYSVEYQKLKRERDSSGNALKILPRSLFVSGVSHFDVFIGRIVKIILDTQPNIISPEKTLSFADIKGFRTIREAIDHLIDKEIDTLLFDSHSAHLDWLSKKTGVQLIDKLSSEIPTFIELTERRNLFVHGDGLVNERYIRQCKEGGAKTANDSNKGSELGMNPEYFKNSMECLYKVATKTSFLLWRKFKKNETEEADEFFNNDIAVNLIKRKKYKLAENLLEFAEAEFAESNDEMRKAMSINLALARKLDNRKTKAIADIDKIDWSACSDDLRLGVAALKDDYTEVFRLMEKIGEESHFINKDSYKDDPIFEDLRHHESFPKVFKKIYGEKFVPPTERERVIESSRPPKRVVVKTKTSKKMGDRKLSKNE
ncbi:MAG: hypothetical protein ACHQU0_01000 [Candidatus Paceibacteria bacterium]